MDFSLDSYEADHDSDHYHSPLSSSLHMEHHHEFDDNGAPVRKRKRTSRACDRCRMKKSKCDGLTPCGRCRLDDVVCVFGEQNHHGREETLHDKHIHLLESQNRSLSEGLCALLHAAQAGNIAHLPPAASLSAGEILELLHPHKAQPQERTYMPRSGTYKLSSTSSSSTTSSTPSTSGGRHSVPRSHPPPISTSIAAETHDSHPPSPTHSASSITSDLSGLATPELGTYPAFPNFSATPTSNPASTAFPLFANPQTTTDLLATPSLVLSAPSSAASSFDLDMSLPSSTTTADAAFWDPTLLPPTADLASATYGFGLFDEPDELAWDLAGAGAGGFPELDSWANLNVGLGLQKGAGGVVDPAATTAMA